MILQDKRSLYIQILHSHTHRITKRASSCISGERKGSVTVETAMSLPIFFLAVISLIYMMEVMAVRTSIRSGMQYAAKSAAESVYLKPMITPGQLESDIIQAVGSERLDRSVVVDGSGGIHCHESRMSIVTGILELKVKYKVRLPVPMFAGVSVPMEESMRIKGWNGYIRNAGFHEDDQTVYITETGMVYHKDYSCHYLELSIRMVPSAELEQLRNKNQGKYHPCEHCVHGAADGGVYITDYGDRYHSSLGCSGIKRTIYAIPLEEAVGKGACSKCCR